MKTLKSITPEQVIIPAFIAIIIGFFFLVAQPSKGTPEKINQETAVGYSAGFYQGSVSATTEYKLK